MGIRQMNREGSPSPKVVETDYGARIITVSTETHVDDIADSPDADNEDTVAAVDVVKPTVAEKTMPEAKAVTKKAGRPRKNKQ